jgi:hypothetical protein
MGAGRAGTRPGALARRQTFTLTFSVYRPAFAGRRPAHRPADLPRSPAPRLLNPRLRTNGTSRHSLLLGLLLCACLIAQTLGLVHRVQHGTAASQRLLAATATATATATTTATATATARGDGHLHLFAGHARASDCQLFDHLGVAELLAGVPMLAVAALRAPRAVMGARAGVVARRTLAFQARGPPVLR